MGQSLMPPAQFPARRPPKAQRHFEDQLRQFQSINRPISLNKLIYRYK